MQTKIEKKSVINFPMWEYFRNFAAPYALDGSLK